MGELIHNFRDLKVWRLGIELVREIYILTRAFPKEEVYGLTSQLRRAAVSIPANIAEGAGRDSLKEYLHHLSISAGSLCEVETLLTITQELQYSTNDQVVRVNAMLEEEGRMLRGLQHSLRARLKTRQLQKDL